MTLLITRETSWIRMTRRPAETSAIAPSRHMYKSLTRTHASILFQIRTGKIELSPISYTVKKTDSPECQCGAPHQTPTHLLFDCPNWTDLRHETLWQGGRQIRDISELLNDPSWAKRAADLWHKPEVLELASQPPWMKRYVEFRINLTN